MPHDFLPLDIYNQMPRKKTTLSRVPKVFTFAYGSDMKEDLEKRYPPGEPWSISKTTLCLSALTRGIDIEKGEDYIKEEYLKQLPSAGWQIDAIDAFSKLSEDEQIMIRSYKSHGYEKINAWLRMTENPEGHQYYLIQEAIGENATS